MNFTVDVFGLTDPGRVRDANQDQFLIAEVQTAMEVDHSSVPCASPDSQTAGHLLAVADGMGGHQNGEEASSIAIASLREYLAAKWHEGACRAGGEDDVTLSNLRSGFEYAHEILREAAQHQSEDSRMGTTLTATLVCENQLYLAHAGDSRCYLLRGSDKKQLTTDHTLAQYFSDHQIRGDEGERAAHVLTNCLGGTTQELVVDHRQLELQPSDVIVLCSDGLTKQVTTEQLRSTIEQTSSSEEACRRLVEAANSAGGMDNITVIVGRYVTSEAPQSAEDEFDLCPCGAGEGSIEDTAPYIPKVERSAKAKDS